ncbi:MAG: hypothetical protein AABY46_03955 [Nitrospirota bacterium]
MGLKTTILNDIILVHARVSFRAGVEYVHTNERVVSFDEESGREEREWDTVRIVASIDEKRQGQSTRYRILRAVEKLGKRTEIGLLVPAYRAPEVDDWYLKAIEAVASYNSQAKVTRMAVSCIPFAPKTSNERVAESLAMEIKQTLDNVTMALSSADPTSLREQIVKLKGYDRIVVPEVGNVLGEMIEDLRAQAINIAASLKERPGDIDWALRTMSFASVDLARFAIGDDSMKDDDFLDAPTNGAGMAMDL